MSVTVQIKDTIDVQYRQSMGEGDAVFAHAAWVSSMGEELPEEYKAPEKVEGLIKYLMKNRHGTPFEHAALTARVHAPIFVWREWHRHRIGWSYNEESARYKKLAPVFYVPPKGRPMFKVDNWKPGRPKFLTYDQFGGGTCADVVEAESRYHKLGDNLIESYKLAYQKYEENLELGIDPGLARDCLPVGIYSACWVTCNPRSLMNFLSLRTQSERANHPSYPLYEIEQGARGMEALFQKYWPVTHAAFCEFGREAP